MTENFLLAGIIAIQQFPQRAVKILTLRLRDTILQKKVNWVSTSGLFCCPGVKGKLFSCAHFIQLTFSDEYERSSQFMAF
jgi:hypothetical protein